VLLVLPLLNSIH